MKHKKGNDVNGWLIVDKPRDMGSTQVVSLTRRLFNAKKNGHTGTLDPFATGILPIAFGEATKLISFVTDGKKEYEFTVQWGEATDTLDTEGVVVATSEKIPTKEEILNVLPSFLGKINQTPPIYSAIKINGQRAYDLARKGVEVEIPTREIEIYNLELVEILENNQAKLKVECSKGTYVRTLGQDIALKLGTVGHLKELRRTKCGNFDLSHKILLEDLKNIVYDEGLEKDLLPLTTCLRDIAVIAVGEADATKLRHGQSLSPKVFDVSHLIDQTAIAMLGDELVAIVRVDERKISSIRVFNL